MGVPEEELDGVLTSIEGAMEDLLTLDIRDDDPDGTETALRAYNALAAAQSVIERWSASRVDEDETRT